MQIKIIILQFIVTTIIRSILTVNMVQDFILWIARNISKRTKNTWDDKIYKRLKYHMKEDKSDRPKF